MGFCAGKVGADGRGGKVSAVLHDLAKQKKCPTAARGDDVFEIRDLVAFKDGASFKGVFAKLRRTDIPHIGEAGGPGREIDLSGDEGLLEKNHFLYHRRHELLIYQANKNGSVVNRLGEYLSDIVNETTVFEPVLQPEALARLMKGDTQLNSLELSFARPTAVQWFPKDNWSKELMELMRDADAARIHIEISAKGYGRGQKKHLSKRMKHAVRELMGHIDARVARVKAGEDGVEHPIDLVADRVKGVVEVEMNGRYPVADKMYAALREVHDEHTSVLREIFGDGHKALD